MSRFLPVALVLACLPGAAVAAAQADLFLAAAQPDVPSIASGSDLQATCSKNRVVFVVACVTFIRQVLDKEVATNSGQQQPKFCPPAKISRGHVNSSVKAWLAAHSQRLSEPAEALAAAAIHGTFPCPSTQART